MKVRIFKKQDGGVLITSFPWHEFNAGISDPSKMETETEFMDRNSINHPKFKSSIKALEYIDVDRSECPVSDSNTGNYHEMIHFDGPCHKDNLKQDKNWEVQLMPQFLVKQKHIKKLEESIDALLEADIKDPIEILSTQRQKEKDFKNKDEVFWMQKALEGLDLRVSNGEPDKPLIRQKLNEKLGN